MKKLITNGSTKKNKKQEREYDGPSVLELKGKVRLVATKELNKDLYKI